MSAVGRRWNEGSLSIAQEHVVSAVLVGAMSSPARLQAAPAAPAVCCLPARPASGTNSGCSQPRSLPGRGGLGPCTSGPTCPRRISPLQPVSRTPTWPSSPSPEGSEPSGLACREIRRLLASTIDLWVGGRGPAAADHPNGKSRRLVRLASLEDFERQLATMPGERGATSPNPPAPHEDAAVRHEAQVEPALIQQVRTWRYGACFVTCSSQAGAAGTMPSLRRAARTRIGRWTDRGGSFRRPGPRGRVAVEAEAYRAVRVQAHGWTATGPPRPSAAHGIVHRLNLDEPPGRAGERVADRGRAGAPIPPAAGAAGRVAAGEAALSAGVPHPTATAPDSSTLTPPGLPDEAP